MLLATGFQGLGRFAGVISLEFPVAQLLEMLIPHGAAVHMFFQPVLVSHDIAEAGFVPDLQWYLRHSKTMSCRI